MKGATSNKRLRWHLSIYPECIVDVLVLRSRARSDLKMRAPESHKATLEHQYLDTALEF